MKNIFVSGGAGFIGSNYVRHVLIKEPAVRIINFDALTYAGNLENLRGLPDPDRHIFVQGNITDQEKVEYILKKYHVDAIVNFAAESHVDRSILGPEEFIQTNIVGTFRLLEAARNIYMKKQIVPAENFRFHHISTDEVFGELGPDDPPFDETTPYSPNSPYAASKASSDHLVRAYYHTFSLPVLITNCSNNYGPYQYPEKLIPVMITNALAAKPLPIYGDGQQIRDWLYVEDHCAALWLVLNKGRSGETYNIGGDSQVPNLTVVKTLCNILDELKPRADGESYVNLIEDVPDRPGHDRRYDIDFSKITSELSWHPKETLESGLLKTVRWYLENTKWIDAVQKQNDYLEWMNKNYEERGGD